MAVHVLYAIHKDGELYDVITHTDQYWLNGSLVSGGVRKAVEEQYKEEDGFTIDVNVTTSGGNQDE